MFSGSGNPEVTRKSGNEQFLHQASARQTLLQVPKTYHELTRLTSVITSYRRSVLDNHLYSTFSILPDSIFHIPSLTPLFSFPITFSFLIMIRLRHTINANATSVETPYDALSSPKIFPNRTPSSWTKSVFHYFTHFYNLI